jgi:aryl-alcohol dehydrogenase-like predicted oxidoreductase
MNHFTLPGITQLLSVLCLGTANYGSGYTRDQSFALLDAFAEAGGNFLDTAHVYADWLPNGHGASERTVGAWLRARGVRDEFVLATKGGHPRLETMEQSRLRPEDLARDLMESLERLGRDRVELYWLHRDDPAVPVGEIVEALNEQRAAGRVHALGASNWQPERLRAAAEYARSRGLTGFVASQVGWSLAVPNEAEGQWYDMLFMDADALRYYCASSLRVIPFSPQAGGFFAHPYDPADPKYALYHSPINAGRWERVRQLADRRGVSANAVALAYLLAHPCGGVAVIGPRTLAQIADSMGAVALGLSDLERKFLENA